MLRERLSDETRLACYLYLGGSDGQLSTAELSFMRRECGTSQVLTIPSRDSLSRKTRSFVLGCRPSLRERRDLLARLLEFARCDGVLSSDEEEALRVIEELLQVSPQARKARQRNWRGTLHGSAAAKEATRKTRKDSGPRSGEFTRESSRASQPQPPRPHWSYEHLGCSEQDSDETIKRCYRRLAVKLHPDKHAGRATTPEQTASHLRAFQKLQEAYEAVSKLRGMERYRR